MTSSRPTPARRDAAPGSTRAAPWARWTALGVFTLGILIPSGIAFAAVWNNAMANAPFFGRTVHDRIDPSSDPTLWATGILMATSSAILGALVVVELHHHRWLISGIALTLISLIPLGLNWYILFN